MHNSNWLPKVAVSLVLLASAMALATVWVLQPTPARAASLVVSSTVDAVDAAPGDGICQTSTPGECTLRAAIMEANALAVADTITLPAGIYTLTLGSELVVTTDVTLTGAGASSTIIQAGASPGVANFRVFNISGGTVDISGVTIRHGNPLGDGGGIRNNATLTLSGSTVSNNIATFGGGIFNSGTLTLANSTISNNTANTGGGGIRNESGGTLAINSSDIGSNTAVGSWGGGGIRNDGALTITDTTINGNIAQHSGAGGGGLYLTGGSSTITGSTISGNTATGTGAGISNWVPLTLLNSTVSGNTASSGAGGIFNRNGVPAIGLATATLVNTTVANNSTAGIGGGIYFFSGTMELLNTIVANNPMGGDCSTAVTTLGHNLDSDGTCGLTGPTDLPNTNPLLGPLQDNGGPTFTHALLPGSPAIDAGDNAGAPSADQRGFPRMVDGDGNGVPVIDIGAYEVEFSPPVLIGSASATNINGDIAADSNGILHVVWLADGDRFYTQNDGSSWSSPVLVGGGGNAIIGMGLAVGPDNALHSVW